MEGIILLGALAIPFLLLAAIIRGGWRAHQERVQRKRDLEQFD